MKKKILLILIIILLTGCTNKLDNKKEIEVKAKTPDIVEPNPPYIDDNPITVGLYQDGHLVKDLYTNFPEKADIAVLEVYFTNDDYTGSSWTKYNFNKYYANYQNIEKYKIGFRMSFTADGEKHDSNLLDPSCMFLFNPHIFIYLYDDVHQADGVFYSHLEPEQVTDETVYSSIKITGIESSTIESPITLTVFTYDGPEDFDENGYYRGNSKYTITINRK